MRRLTLAGLGLVLALGACGYSTSDRALSGAAIGAGAGAAGAAITGADPLSGAAIGGAVGAATGGLTDADDINLGDPVWRGRRY
jgi:osmotically inducible lipoprotein OsmB